MYKILLVDDEQEIRNGYSRYFPWEQHGFEVSCVAEDGQKALQLIAEEPVDLVLCDIVMPNISGIELAEKIREMGLDVKIIILSGYSDFEYARRAFASGAFDYILKSDKHSVLIKSLERLKAQLDMEKSPPIQMEESELISRIKNYIDAHYQTVTLQDCSDYVHLSPAYVSRLFKEKTGVNFYSHVLQVKLEHAKRLLENPSIKVYDIADKIGYSNPKNFNRVFRKMAGMSPTDYRNKFVKL